MATPTLAEMINACNAADVYWRLHSAQRTEAMACAIVASTFDGMHSFVGVYGVDYFIVNNADATEALYLAIRAWNDFHPEKRVRL